MTLTDLLAALPGTGIAVVPGGLRRPEDGVLLSFPLRRYNDHPIQVALRDTGRGWDLWDLGETGGEMFTNFGLDLDDFPVPPAALTYVDHVLEAAGAARAPDGVRKHIGPGSLGWVLDEIWRFATALAQVAYAPWAAEGA